MEDVKPYSAEVKSRGQLTIPKKIREAGCLDEGQEVTIIPIGDSLLVSPRILKLNDIRRELRKMMKASGLSLQDLIDGLKEERSSNYNSNYGRKNP
ncbi:MAG TPA: AbrB/MazE/SpoVT family DNA-binding domain-containing protein [Desulfobacteraceae bacterium]|nr:AbrB/MazE/SpoVT family DNA-binding domain-containing protein [Desulfobacteraceae bacterium]